MRMYFHRERHWRGIRMGLLWLASQMKVAYTAKGVVSPTIYLSLFIDGNSHLGRAGRHRFSAFWLRSKCSICSYQLNIWYVPHRGTSILNWFLELGGDTGACSGSSTGWPGIAVPPGSAHSPWGEKINKILIPTPKLLAVFRTGRFKISFYLLTFSSFVSDNRAQKYDVTPAVVSKRLSPGLSVPGYSHCKQAKGTRTEETVCMPPIQDLSNIPTAGLRYCLFSRHYDVIYIKRY